MDASDQLRRWPYDTTEALAYEMLRCYVAIDGLLHDDLGRSDWTQTEIAAELLRRLHTRVRHMAADLGRDDVTITLSTFAEMVNRLLPHSFDPEASPVFQPRDPCGA